MYRGYRFHNAWAIRALITFPLRLHSITTNRSVSKEISYWYRAHLSQTRSPIVFIHGIGIGAYTHVSFLSELASPSPAEDDGQVGIIAIELSAISARLCASTPSASEVKDQIRIILKHHGWEHIVLVGHS